MIYLIKDPHEDGLYEFHVALETDYNNNLIVNICNTAVEFEWGDPVETIDIPLTAVEELSQALLDLLKEAKTNPTITLQPWNESYD